MSGQPECQPGTFTITNSKDLQNISGKNISTRFKNLSEQITKEYESRISNKKFIDDPTENAELIKKIEKLTHSLTTKINNEATTSSQIVMEPYLTLIFELIDPKNEPIKEDKSFNKVIESNIKLSKVEQSKSGAYTSENYSLDYSTKTYNSNIYTYDPEKTESLEVSTTLSDKFVFSNGVDTPVQGAKDFTSAHIEYIPINSGAYLDGVESTEDSGQLYTDLTEKAIAKLNSYRSLSNNTSHDIRLHGDLQLNPGRVIQLLFPKALDPDILKEYLETDDTDVYDKTLSGKYFIAAVEHTFEGGEYYVNCRVKRDSRANEIE